MAKTLLIVDDSASIRQVVSMTLKGAGYDVIEASNASEALGKLTGQRVNLIISDVNAPSMDGLTLIEEVKRLPAYRFTPFVMLTTETEQDKRERARAAGAKAWVIKPFHPQQMLDAVAKLVQP